MPDIEFPCVFCGRQLRLVPGTVARVAFCPGCGAINDVPASPENAAEAEPAADAAGIEAEAASYESAPPPPSSPGSPPPEEPAVAVFGPEPVRPAYGGGSGNPFAGGWADDANPYASPTQYGRPAYGSPAPADGRAVASLVLGLIGLASAVMCCPLVGLPIGGVGLALGIPAMKSLSRSLAIAGVVASAIAVVVGVLTAVVTAFFFALAAATG